MEGEEKKKKSQVHKNCSTTFLLGPDHHQEFTGIEVWILLKAELRFGCVAVLYLFEEDVVHDDHGRQVGVGAPHHGELGGLWP